jgi:hypothetical protein
LMGIESETTVVIAKNKAIANTTKTQGCMGKQGGKPPCWCSLNAPQPTRGLAPLHSPCHSPHLRSISPCHRM